jgi:PAS domain S-box-containing protein
VSGPAWALLALAWLGLLGLALWFALRQRAAARRSAAEAGELREQLELRMVRAEALGRLAPVGLILWDERARLVDANEAACRMLGITREAFLEGGWTEALHPEDIGRVLTEWRRASAARQPWLFEYRIACAGGAVRHVREWEQPYFRADGSFAGYCGVLLDVSAELRHAAELEAAHDRLRRLLDVLPDPVVVKDRELRYVLVNDAFCRLLGKPREAIAGHRAADIYPDQRAAEYDARDRAIFDAGLALDVEGTLTDALGRTRRVLRRHSFATGPDGAPLLVRVIRDVTEEREAQAQLAATKDFLAAVLDAVPYPVIVKDEALRHVEINPVACRHLGRARGEILGRTPAELFPEVYAAEVGAIDREALASGASRDVQRVSVAADGTRREVIDRVVPFESGGRRMTVRVLNDVSEARRAQRELETSNAFLDAVLAAIPDPLYVKDAERRYVYVNDAACASIGRPRAAILGRTVSEVVPHERAAQIDHVDALVLASGRPDRRENELRAPGAPRRFVLSTRSIAYDPAGRPILVRLARDVTAERLALEQLRASEERFQLAAAGATDAIWDWDFAGRTLFLSERWRDFLGIAGEVPARRFIRHWRRAVHPDDALAVERAFERFVAGHDEVYRCECRLRVARGWVWLLVRGAGRRGAGGWAYRIAGSVSDVSAQRRHEQSLLDAQAELARAEARLRTMIETMDAAVSMYDARDRLVLCNERFRLDHGPLAPRVQRGISARELIAMSIELNGGSPDPALSAAEYLEQRLAARAAQSDRHEVRLGGRWVLILNARTPQGELVSLRTDITELREREDALRRLAQVVEQTSEAIVTKDLDNRVLSWNAGAEKLYGYPAREMLGRPVHELLWIAAGTPGELAALAATLRAGRVERTRERRRHRDGRILEVEIAYAPLRNAEGGIIGEIAVSRDIGAEVAARAAIEEARAAAERANRAKSDFLMNMSHELRTPMHAMLSFARLGRDHEREPKLLGYFERIEASGRRLLALLDNLLDLSRLEAGALGFERAPADLRALLADVRDEFEPYAASRGATLAVSAAAPVHADCDAVRIRQVIANLVSNAIRHGAAGGRIDLAARARPEGGVLVEVSDRGPGLPEDELDAVFERFAQSRRTRDGGAGLGLAICRAIVEAHGGRIAARNNPGGGSTFWFELPAATPNDHQPEQLHAA